MNKKEIKEIILANRNKWLDRYKFKKPDSFIDGYVHACKEILEQIEKESEV